MHSGIYYTRRDPIDAKGTPQTKCSSYVNDLMGGDIMLHRAKNKGSTWFGHTEHNPVQKMHRHLAWALGTATIVLIVNAVMVVALLEAG